jgi:hypothetical protein
MFAVEERAVRWFAKHGDRSRRCLTLFGNGFSSAGMSVQPERVMNEDVHTIERSKMRHQSAAVVCEVAAAISPAFAPGPH